jgi:hypothetical protein
MLKSETDKRGGARIGSGRPRKEETALFNFQIPATLKADLKKKYPKGLNKKVIAFLQSLL